MDFFHRFFQSLVSSAMCRVTAHSTQAQRPFFPQCAGVTGTCLPRMQHEEENMEVGTSFSPGCATLPTTLVELSVQCR